MFIRKIASIRKYISQSNCETLVHAFITSRLDMCNVLFFGMSEKNINKLQKIQNAAIRVIFSLKKRDHVSDLLLSLHWLSVRQRISFKVLIIVFKCLHCLAPVPLRNLISIRDRITMQLDVSTFFPSSMLGRRAFSFYAPRQWNALPVPLRQIQSLDTFKAKLKHHIFMRTSPDYTVNMTHNSCLSLSGVYITLHHFMITLGAIVWDSTW
jgi:hypothetical protein